MTSASRVQVDRGTASALPGVPGVPWWGAVLIAVVLTALGIVVSLNGDVKDPTSVLAWVLTLVGVIAAALAVRRHAVFTAMVQPPLVVAAGLVIGFLIAGDGKLLTMAFDLIATFPLMLVATAAALLIGMVRIIAQPLRAARPSRQPHSRAAV